MSQPFRDCTNKTSTPVSKLMRSVNDLSLRKTPASAGRRTYGLQNQSFNQSLVNGAVIKKGLKKREVTPTRNSSYLASAIGGGDRYVGMRRTEDELDLANHLMRQPVDSTFNTSNSAPSSPAKATESDQMKKMMRVKSAGCLVDESEEDRILCYKKNAAPLPPIGHMNRAKVLYSTQCVQPSSVIKKSTRHIPTLSERILDAPEFQDDFYSNLIDWGANGVVAVALSHSLYLWEAESGNISVLFEMDPPTDSNLITSVKWAQEGTVLAVGFKDGTLRIYDPNRQVPAGAKQELRTMRVPRQSRNGVLAWRGALVSAGYQSGQIIHHDVRIPDHVTCIWEGHEREVIGLQWSLDEKLLASGSGDTTVHLWDHSRLGETTQESLFHLVDHMGSVRAVQFCNFKASLLATGGGSQCKTIKLWNVHTGEIQKSLDTGSSVNSIIFNKDYKEMMSAQATGELIIWKYPNYTEVTKLTGHNPTGRALSLVTSPCGQYVMSAGGDETLRMWLPFKVDKSLSKMSQRSNALGMVIR